MLSVQVP